MPSEPTAPGGGTPPRPPFLSDLIDAPEPTLPEPDLDLDGLEIVPVSKERAAAHRRGARREAEHVLPDSPSGWYYVTPPVDTYVGNRYGKVFTGQPPNDITVHTNERRVSAQPGGADYAPRLVDLFAYDLGYRVEPVPEGLPPVPRSALAAAGISSAVANS